VPHAILDAPDINDDFYCNVLSWSAKDHIAIGLGSDVSAGVPRRRSRDFGLGQR
jgi:hypothetical protein